MLDLQIEKEQIEEKIEQYKELIKDKDKENEISVSKTYLEDLEEELWGLNRDEEELERGLTDMDLEIAALEDTQ